MSDGIGGPLRTVSLKMFTDAFTVKGRLETRHRRISDALNEAPAGFLVLSDVQFDEYRTASAVMRAEFAQVNLGSVLFVVSDEVVAPEPALATPKVSEEALISIPPFTIKGRIHLLAERPLREGLSELHGEFIPVTNAVYWSDSLGEARTGVALAAVNHARCQILAPHHEVDPWAGMPTGSPSDGSPSDGPSSDGPPSEPSGW